MIKRSILVISSAVEKSGKALAPSQAQIPPLAPLGRDDKRCRSQLRSEYDFVEHAAASARRSPLRQDLTAALLTAALLAAALLTPRPAEAQSRNRFLHWTYRDAAALATDAAPRAVPYALAGTAALFPLTIADGPLTRSVEVDPSAAVGDGLHLVDLWGSNRMRWPAAALFGASLFTRNARFQDAAFTSFQSLIYAGLINSAAKSVAGRFRPSSGADAYRFEPLGGATSFPSGHTATAFALSVPWVLYYPHPATYSLLALSAGTAVSRVIVQKHWPTDVLAGAAIGIATGVFLTARHQQAALSGGRFRVTPAVGPGSISLSLRVALP